MSGSFAKTGVIITAEDRSKAGFDSFNRSLGSAQNHVRTLTGLLGTFGAVLSGAGIVSGLKNVIDDADEIGKASQKFGIAASELSALAYAGKLSDVSFEALGQGVKKLSTNMADAAAGTGEAKDAFKVLGISVKGADGALKSSQAIMGEVADRFAGMEDGAGKTALAVRLFGRAGADLIPLLNQGSRGIAEMKDEAEKFGAIIDDELAAQSERFNDNLTRLAASFDGLKISLTSGVIGDLVDFTNAQVEATKIAGSFGESLRLFAFNLDAMTAEKPAEEIKRLTKALEDYQEASKVGKFAQSPTGFMFGGREEDLKKQIEFLKYLQREEALAITAGMRGRLDAKDPGPTRLGKAPTLPSSVKQGKAKADTYAGLAGFDDNRSAKETMAELHAEDKAMEALRQQYADMADPLQKYRVQLDEINMLREKGVLTLAQAIEAEWRVDGQMQKTFETMTDGKASIDTLGESFKELGRIIEGWGQGAADAIVNFTVTGKSSFSDMAQSIMADMAKMLVYKNITGPMATAIGGMFKPNADGNVYTSASLSKYSSGVYDSPQVFAFAQGAGIFAEAGPEAIMPLKRGPDGKLGVQSNGGGGVVINNYTGAPVTTREVPDGRGGRKLEVQVGELVAAQMLVPGSAANRARRAPTMTRRG